MVEEAEAAVQRLVSGAGQPELGAGAGALLLLSAAAQRPPEQALRLVQAVLDRTWERLNTGHWSQVPAALRQLFTLASLHKQWQQCQRTTAPSPLSHEPPLGSSLVPRTEEPTSSSVQLILPPSAARANILEVRLLLALRQPGAEPAALRAALAAADQGLLLGAQLPGQGEGQGLAAAAAVLAAALRGLLEQPEPQPPPAAPPPQPLPGGVRGQPVADLQRPPLETFLLEHWTPQRPARLRGCLSHWPALRRWPDLGYLQRVAGARTVPVELGAHYAHPGWAQRLMTLEEFVRRHVEAPAEGTGPHRRRLGYLAQHPLLEQVPELRADIRVPDYCCLSDGPDSGAPPEPEVNAWFGPAGTVSPLHFDPKHNLLAQVVGSKRVLLYPPGLSARLYPHEGTLLSNTAQVDPEAPDYERFPEYRSVEALECLLEAGDMLYIPPRWWHHVRALATSFSVSFWWE